MKQIKFFDIIIILCALISGVGLLFSASFQSIGGKDRICLIEIDGQEFKRINLSKVLEDEEIKIKNNYGENHILINKDGAIVTYSDCVAKVEMQEKPINKPGQALVCLPHRLVIKIVGDEFIPDAVTY